MAGKNGNAGTENGRGGNRNLGAENTEFDIPEMEDPVLAGLGIDPEAEILAKPVRGRLIKKPKDKTQLSPREALFVEHYLVSLNAKEAAIKAGYSRKSADIHGSNILSKNLFVKAAVEKAMAARAAATQVTAAWVLKEIKARYERLKQLNDSDIADIYNGDGTLKPVDQWPEVWRRKASIKSVEVMEQFEDQVTYEKGKPVRRKVLRGYLKKVLAHELTGAELKSLELLGKHTDVGAFAEKHEYSGQVTLNVQYELPAARRLPEPGEE